jgi:hypothetical protein
MTINKTKTAVVIGKKQGIPIYDTNPSLIDARDIKQRKAVKLGNEQKGLVLDGGGEILGVGSAVFYEYQEVDNERFIKLYRNGIKQATGMTKAGLEIFDYVCSSVQDNPNSDEVKLSFYRVAEKIPGLQDRTYRRGLRELLDLEFIFRSPEEGVFFINIKYLFNGDRLAFVSGFKRTKALPTIGVST